MPKPTFPAPPKRDAAPAVPATSTPSASERVPINARITAERAEYLRLLAAKTRTKQYELIESAIDLLRKEAGEP